MLDHDRTFCGMLKGYIYGELSRSYRTISTAVSKPQFALELTITHSL